MLENGDINDDEVEQIQNSYVTKITSNFNTQESIVFFTLGNGPNDEDRELYMININDWITASYGYNKICNAIDQNDVSTVFSTIPNFASASIKQYSDHAWYAGFNCKADGTGFKTQLFLDDTCTTFSPTLNDYYPFTSSSTSATNANANQQNAAQDYSTQVASDLTRYMVQKINNIIANSQYCDESEFCDNVLDTSVDLVTCLKNGEEANDDDDGAAADDENCNCNEDGEEEDCDCRRRLRTTRQQRNLYSYQLSYDEASNVQDACPSIQTAMSLDEQYEYTDLEAEERISLWSNIKNGDQEADRSSSSSAVLNSTYWLYIGGLLVAGCIAILLVLSRMKKFEMQKFGKSCLDADDNPKNEPLCGSESQVRSCETNDTCEDQSEFECQMTQKERRRKARKSSSSSVRSTRSKSSSSRGRSRLRGFKKTKS
ncbi:hypothetical protein FRACYDRAFT_251038 [Fragilariopsis cylindrus CCMP1102]|uniref:Uncharacterized protein n=1 Tax=Fragilariopsis cylindrus CCMP1102 TaxID=635003 RepID=A0A1E7EP18_9STRA|nr:hypothetical protein FRACYDRAFT_251038 [Fragilariopsis cylindrus CCMP1102]|eukprot:OEU07615.1 hypothetical protein FRACYDRAFT_251038 [Fragilariopsis cylindrus CCMP1102]